MIYNKIGTYVYSISNTIILNYYLRIIVVWKNMVFPEFLVLWYIEFANSNRLLLLKRQTDASANK